MTVCPQISTLRRRKNSALFDFAGCFTVQVLWDLYAFKHGEGRAWTQYTELWGEKRRGKRYERVLPSIDRNGPALTNYANKFIFLTGNNRVETMDLVECYSVRHDVWCTAPSLQCGRYYHSSCSLGASSRSSASQSQSPGSSSTRTRSCHPGNINSLIYSQ